MPISWNAKRKWKNCKEIVEDPLVYSRMLNPHLGLVSMRYASENSPSDRFCQHLDYFQSVSHEILIRPKGWVKENHRMCNPIPKCARISPPSAYLWSTTTVLIDCGLFLVWSLGISRFGDKIAIFEILLLAHCSTSERDLYLAIQTLELTLVSEPRLVPNPWIPEQCNSSR